jgi:hypothetical protein
MTPGLGRVRNKAEVWIPGSTHCRKNLRHLTENTLDLPSPDRSWKRTMGRCFESGTLGEPVSMIAALRRAGLGLHRVSEWAERKARSVRFDRRLSTTRSAYKLSGLLISDG